MKAECLYLRDRVVYRLMRKQVGGYQALVVGVAFVYLGIVLAVPLLHTDDCSSVPRSKTPGTSFPSDTPCPACKFLATSHSSEILYDATPALAQTKIPEASIRDSQIVLASPITDSIFLRAPPSTCRS